MQKRKSYKKIWSEDDLPISVPSTDDAWMQMRKKLDDNMPAGALPAGRAKRFTGSIIAILLLLLALFITWQVYNYTGNSARPVITSHGNNDESGTPGETGTREMEKNDRGKNGGEKKNNTRPNPQSGQQGNDLTKSVSKTDERAIESEGLAGDNNNLNRVKRKRPGTTKDAYTDMQHETGAGNRRTTGKGVKRKNKSIKENIAADVNLQKTGENVAGTEDFAARAFNDSATNSTRNDVLISKVPPTDSTEIDNGGADINVPPEPLEIQAGLQWSLQLPVGGASNYFVGANAESQPYRFLLPGVWLHLRADQSIFTVEVNPFFSELTRDRSFGTYTSIENINDTIVTIVQTKTMRKIFGVSAGLGYLYNISANWWAGGAVQGNWITKAVATTDGNEQKRPANGSPATIIPFKNTYVLTKEEWPEFAKFQMYLNAGILYRTNRWQAGFKAGIPLTPLSKTGKNINSLNVEFLFRLTVLERHVRL